MNKYWFYSIASFVDHRNTEIWKFGLFDERFKYEIEDVVLLYQIFSKIQEQKCHGENRSPKVIGL